MRCVCGLFCVCARAHACATHPGARARPFLYVCVCVRVCVTRCKGMLVSSKRALGHLCTLWTFSPRWRAHPKSVAAGGGHGDVKVQPLQRHCSPPARAYANSETEPQAFLTQAGKRLCTGNLERSQRLRMDRRSQRLAAARSGGGGHDIGNCQLSAHICIASL